MLCRMNASRSSTISPAVRSKYGVKSGCADHRCLRAMRSQSSLGESTRPSSNHVRTSRFDYVLSKNPLRNIPMYIWATLFTSLGGFIFGFDTGSPSFQTSSGILMNPASVARLNRSHHCYASISGLIRPNLPSPGRTNCLIHLDTCLDILSSS
jgi:hypothetical protein